MTKCWACGSLIRWTPFRVSEDVRSFCDRWAKLSYLAEVEMTRWGLEGA